MKLPKVILLVSFAQEMSTLRDPLTVNENGELVCVGQVEENTLVSIMKGNKDSLIIAAEEAAIESMKRQLTQKRPLL